MSAKEYEEQEKRFARADDILYVIESRLDYKKAFGDSCVIEDLLLVIERLHARVKDLERKY